MRWMLTLLGVMSCYFSFALTVPAGPEIIATSPANTDPVQVAPVAKKGGFLERLAVKIARKKIMRQLSRTDDTTGFNAVGFIVGFLFPPFGYLLAVILSRDKNFKKWALFGLLTALLVALIIVIAAFPGFK